MTARPTSFLDFCQPPEGPEASRQASPATPANVRQSWRRMMTQNFCVSRRNYGHWDVSGKEGRLFRLRGGPSQWDVIDERTGKGQNSSMLSFKDQSAAMAYICAELMHELLTVEGQQPYVMEGWNIDWTRAHDPLGPVAAKPLMEKNMTHELDEKALIVARRVYLDAKSTPPLQATAAIIAAYLSAAKSEPVAVMKAAYLLGRSQWIPAGILSDGARTERDWQDALATLLASEPANG